jgi:hypothetical protein
MTFSVSRQQHVWHAALLWLVMGTVLGTHGVIWILGDPHTHRVFPLILPLAVLLGVAKGVAALGRAAAGAIARIGTLPARSPFWQLYSPATYLMILAMMGFGIFFRWAGKHWHLGGVVGILYLVIGVALIAGSYAYWSARPARCGEAA